MSRHANISVFVPHIGCPNRCSFCNQHTITGVQNAPDETTVHKAVKTAMASKNYCPKTTELAFFGGSFTAIDFDYMKRLLAAGYAHVAAGEVCGIRISTRPDAITKPILETLKQYGVTAIELGCQSLRDEVLRLNRRGHTAKDVQDASNLIRQYGFSLGHQMMTGLWGDDDNGAEYTAEEIIKIKPDTVRIYPTLVLQNTELERLMQQNKYAPQTLEQAVALTAKLLQKFENAGIRVIRTGLHSVEQNGFVAGPWHPAFGELCESRYLLNLLLQYIETHQIKKGKLTVLIPTGQLSKMVGQKRANLQTLLKMGYDCTVKQEKNVQAPFEVLLDGFDIKK